MTKKLENNFNKTKKREKPKEKLTQADKNFIKRFGEMLDFTGDTEEELGKKLNMSQTKAHRVKKGDTDTQMSTVFRFFKSYPDFSLEYLFNNKGPIKSSFTLKDVENMNATEISQLKDRLEEVEKQVERLEAKAKK